MRFLVRRVLYVMLEPEMRRAFGFPEPSRVFAALVVFAMRARAVALRMLPHRRHPVLRTQMPHRTYPAGHDIDDIANVGPSS
jgi:hypothetical protein